MVLASQQATALLIYFRCKVNPTMIAAPLVTGSAETPFLTPRCSLW
jgi:hypothetical protein